MKKYIYKNFLTSLLQSFKLIWILTSSQNVLIIKSKYCKHAKKFYMAWKNPRHLHFWLWESWKPISWRQLVHSNCPMIWVPKCLFLFLMIRVYSWLLRVLLPPLLGNTDLLEPINTVNTIKICNEKHAPKLYNLLLNASKVMTINQIMYFLCNSLLQSVTKGTDVSKCAVHI